MKDLKDLPAPILHLLKKLVAEACDGRRSDLGQTAGEFAVDETVVLTCQGTVKVSKSSPDAIIAQKAKPWALLATAIEEANRQLAAAGAAGINLERVVELAENADPELAKEAEKKAKKHLKEIKEEVRGFRWGGVRPEGSVTVIARGDRQNEGAA